MTHTPFVVMLALLIGLPLLLVGSRALRMRRSATVALLQDAAPVVLGLSWIAAVVAVCYSYWWIAAIGLGLGLYHIAMLRRSARVEPVPAWAAAAPTVQVAAANVYVDNTEVELAAKQLAELDVDVIVVVETTPGFRAAFDTAGGADRYPHRAFDADDDSDYAASIYTRAAPAAIEMRTIGRLRAACATIEVAGRPLQIVGVIPPAAVDRGGYRLWRRDLRSLARFARRCATPLVIVGDLNTTVHRVEFEGLTAAGLHDVHEALGQGVSPSFALAASGPLAAVGHLVRLDHALVNHWVWPTAADDLDAAGSDHKPFVATLAVNPSPDHRRGRRRWSAPSRQSETQRNAEV